MYARRGARRTRVCAASAIPQARCSSRDASAAIQSRCAVKCLKEWASVVQALGAGEATLVLRKGGIGERGFKLVAREFLLMETLWHQEADEGVLQDKVRQAHGGAVGFKGAQDDVEITYGAEITGAWMTEDSSVVKATSKLHVFGEGVLDTRLKWRHPITLVELRVLKLASRLVLPSRKGFGGCTSWASLEVAEVGDWVAHAEPVISQAAFETLQSELREEMRAVRAEPLALPVGRG